MPLIIKQTENSAIYTRAKRRFNQLADMINADHVAKCFFLSSVNALERRESIVGMQPAIEKILARHSIERNKATSISNDIFAKIGTIITQRKAVSVSNGHFAMIEPYVNARRIITSSKPSIEHIYGSYYANITETINNIKECLNQTVSVEQIAQLLSRLPQTICKTREKYFICSSCHKFSTSKIRCPHNLIKLNLFKMDELILEGLKRSITLPAYVARCLSENHWKILVEHEVKGTKNLYHQVDVLCQGRDFFILIECKNWTLDMELGPKDVFRMLGKYGDLEFMIHRIRRYKNFKVLKAFITTGRFNKDVKNLADRNDLIFLDHDDMILDRTNQWRRKIESKI